MSFNPTDYISLLNGGSGQQSEGQQQPEDPFDDFLNIPDHYTFEDVGPSEPTLRQEDSGRQANFSELARLVESQGFQALPKSATSGPNRIAATPTTALAQLQKKSHARSKPIGRQEIVPIVQPTPGEPAPAPELAGLTPDVLALYTQLLAGVAQQLPQPVQAPLVVQQPQPTYALPTFDSLSHHDLLPLSNLPSTPSTPSPDNLDIETDKRQRNNAASARFRAKKKLRDQVLARTAEESVARLEMLERRCREQEMEIKWLRSLTATQLEKGGHYKSFRELYAENGVAWVEDLVASDDSAAVTSTARHALAPVPVAPVPELQPIIAPVDNEVSVAETLKRQLVAAQPRSAKKQRLL